MVKSLKDMIKDEDGLATLETCITMSLVELVICINPLSWMCCLPCLTLPAALGRVLAGIIADTSCLPCEIFGVLLSIFAVLSGAITPKELLGIIIQSFC